MVKFERKSNFVPKNLAIGKKTTIHVSGTLLTFRIFCVKSIVTLRNLSYIRHTNFRFQNFFTEYLNISQCRMEFRIFNFFYFGVLFSQKPERSQILRLDRYPIFGKVGLHFCFIPRKRWKGNPGKNGY